MYIINYVYTYLLCIVDDKAFLSPVILSKNFCTLYIDSSVRSFFMNNCQPSLQCSSIATDML